MHLKKVGKYYHAQFRTETGKLRSVTTHCTDAVTAKKVAKESGVLEMETAARVGRLTNEVVGRIKAGGKLTLAKAVAEYATWMGTIGRSPKTIHNNLTTLQFWLNHRPGLSSMSPAAINEDYIASFINAEGVAKANSRAVMLSALRSFFSFCSAKGWCIGDPARLVRVDKSKLTHEQKEIHPRRCFTETEIKTLLAFTLKEGKDFWHAAIRLSSESGLRLGDVAKLEWGSLTQEPGRVIVHTDKTDARVSVPISDDLVTWIAGHVPVSHARYLFPDQAELYLDQKRQALLSVQFGRLCEKLGIEGKSFHSLRHGFITELRKQGKEWEDIATLVGHASTETTKGYSHE
jgi:site-specific recombinase XerD